MTVALIWAQSANGVVGRGGRLPWRLPEDQVHFRKCTQGATVVMGRRTWESLPEGFRPLPGRRNVVLSRRPGWSAAGARVADSVEHALATSSGDVWVIGGAEVWEAALRYADRVVCTELEQRFDGDVSAPALDEGWQRVRQDPESGWHTSRTGLRFRIVQLDRAAGSPPGERTSPG